MLFLSPERAEEQFLKHLYCIISFLRFVRVRCHTTSLECFQEMRLEGLKTPVFSGSIYSVVSWENVPPGFHRYIQGPVMDGTCCTHGHSGFGGTIDHHYVSLTTPLRSTFPYFTLDTSCGLGTFMSSQR